MKTTYSVLRNGVFATLLAATSASAFAATVRPKATDEALINPGMGLVHFAYSSRIWAYDLGLEPDDTLDELAPGIRYGDNAVAEIREEVDPMAVRCNNSNCARRVAGKCGKIEA